jgi:hypothetical protein
MWRVNFLLISFQMDGFLTFRLEFHVTRLALNSTPPGHGKHTARGVFSDLAFLNILHPTGKRRDFRIEKSQFGLLICGWDDTKWTAYAFGNRAAVEDVDADDECEPEEDVHQEQQGPEEHDAPEDIPSEDMIATDYRRHFSVDPATTDPRLYFLIVAESIIHMIAEDGAKIMCRVEESVARSVRIAVPGSVAVATS